MGGFWEMLGLLWLFEFLDAKRLSLLGMITAMRADLLVFAVVRFNEGGR